MYRFARSNDVPEIEQDNDIDGTFVEGKPVGIPADLLALVHAAPSRDPEPEEIEQVAPKLDAAIVNTANPNSRFTLVDTAIHAPGTCILCKSAGGDGRQFLDLGIQITWVGALYFCTFCVTEAAKLLGLVPGFLLEASVECLQEEISNGDDRYVETKVKLDAAMVLLRDHLAGNCVPVADSLENAEADDADAIADARNSVSESESSDSNEPDADKSAPVEGTDDVPAAASGTKRKPAIRNTRPGKSA